MRKLLSSPVQMGLSEAENTLYQNILKYAAELSLNLLAVKVEERPENFLAWCEELYLLCRDGINYDLMEPAQLVPLKKMQDLLVKGISIGRIKMLRIASWPVFAEFVKKQNADVLAEKIRLLEFVKPLAGKPLGDLTSLDLLTILGKHTQDHDPSVYQFDVEWFGATKGAKIFQLLLSEQTEKFDQALAFIPLEGPVTKADYDKFVASYSAIFHSYTEEKANGEKAPMVPATRLLGMRRPDQFVVLTAPKIDVYCQGLAAAKFNGFDFEGYWHDLIETIHNASWWRQAEPEDELEKQIWNSRAALTDMYLFADDNIAEQSNYVKLKLKIEARMNKVAAGGAPRRRSKESAESLVDRRLAEDDIPEYLHGKRDSLVHEVKNGKSVDQAIKLFRAIFG